jgi:hypothetical protein
MLVSARHLLWPHRRHRAWTRLLEAYDQVPERFRAYRIDGRHRPAERIEPTWACTRFSVYDQTLEQVPPFTTRELPLAGEGAYKFVERRNRRTSVNIPAELASADGAQATGHDVDAVPGSVHDQLEVPLGELRAIAREMDEAEADRAGTALRPGHWADRMRDVDLDVRTAAGTGFEGAEVLRIDRLLHLVGMVGAGKTTLMVVLTVWGAKKGLRTTLVVGDVAEQLRLTELLRSHLGDSLVAAVLGASTREQHVQRLHRRLDAQGLTSLLQHDDEPAFDDLSTACVIDALRGTDPMEPLRYRDAPCTALHATVAPAPDPGDKATTAGRPGSYRDHAKARMGADTSDNGKGLGPDLGCPIWHRCPRHKSARTLTDALVWVANPASLVLTQVPQHLNEERLRYLELACLRSDLVIVDEADRVQMTLDRTFAPSATLVSRGPESWLDRLHTHNIEELSREGRLQLSQQVVARWARSLSTVSAAANHLYEMLIRDPLVQGWADTEYFSPWTLQEKLLREWFPLPGEETSDGLVPDVMAEVHEAELFSDDDGDAGVDVVARVVGRAQWEERREEVNAILDRFRDDPLGDRGPHDPLTDRLSVAASDLLSTLDSTRSWARIRTLVDELLVGSPVLTAEPPADDKRRGGGPTTKGKKDTEEIAAPGSAQWYDQTVRRLGFTLLLAVLIHRLDRVTFLWPEVEAALKLDPAANDFSRRPPLDYAPLIPESPMGNVLGFQFQRDTEPDREGHTTGTLRFFRCAGVGRELLLSLPDLGANTGTGRPGPHVMLMSGTSWAGTSTRAHVLAPVGAVLKPEDGKCQAVRATTFTTRFLHDRRTGLPLYLSGQHPTMRLTALREIVTNLASPSTPGVPSPLEEELSLIADERRRRLLLLVGSYQQAEAAADQLQKSVRWRDRVRVLVSDDADLDQEAAGHRADATAVRRGDLASFADDPDAEVLLAPLLSIERGHNILNDRGEAAFGAVLFLVRPHPVPDDMMLAVFAVNDWVSRFVRNLPCDTTGTGKDTAASFRELVEKAGHLGEAGMELRRAAHGKWRYLLSRSYAYSRLPEGERESFAWDQLVTIWQVIGRLVRGGVPARVVFVDAKFAPGLASVCSPNPEVAKRARPDTAVTSLLHGIRDVLAPHFDLDVALSTFADPADPALVQLLYRPVFDALTRMPGLAATSPSQPGDLSRRTT